MTHVPPQKLNVLNYSSAAASTVLQYCRSPQKVDSNNLDYPIRSTIGTGVVANVVSLPVSSIIIPAVIAELTVDVILKTHQDSGHKASNLSQGTVASVSLSDVVLRVKPSSLSSPQHAFSADSTTRRTICETIGIPTKTPHSALLLLEIVQFLQP